MSDRLRVLVVTVVHHPFDARIYRREIAALLDAGHEVTYVAPFSGYGVARPESTQADVVESLRTIDVHRAVGRRRVKAFRDARRTVRRLAPDHDVVLVHDPELVLATARLAPLSDGTTVLGWDVHEDIAASVALKPWLPSLLRAPAEWLLRSIERYGERNAHLLLAEYSYADRFKREHAVVPNSTPVPDEVVAAGDQRVVYLGAVSAARGAHEMIALGRVLRAYAIEVHVIGGADSQVRPALEQANAVGDITWHGFMPNEPAMELVDGSLAGLSLLHDQPNYRRSRPTKIVEYMAHGVPVVTTPNLEAQRIVEDARCGVVVPFDATADELASAVLGLRDDVARRASMAAAGHAKALAEYNWAVDGPRFVEVLESWAAKRR